MNGHGISLGIGEHLIIMRRHNVLIGYVNFNAGLKMFLFFRSFIMIKFLLILMLIICFR